jgi:integrase
MAWAEQLPNGNWRARWRDDTGTAHGTTTDAGSGAPFRSKADAKRYAGAREEEARHGVIGRDGRAPTWGTWAEEWLKLRRVETSTMQQDLRRMNKYLTPEWGHRRVNTITRREVQKWVNDLTDTELSPSTVTRVLHLFSASMKAAVLDDRVPVATNPCQGVKAPQETATGHERYLTRQQVDDIAYYLGEPYRAAWLLLCGTGLRFGELAGLHWHRVTEFGIVVQETWDPAAKRIKPYPKGKKPRTVPIVGWVRDLLDQLEQRPGADAKSCGQSHGPGARCRSALVVTSPEGHPLDVHNFRNRHFAPAVALAGLEGVRPHDARHTWASWLRQGGVDLEEVQKLLGHKSIVTTQRYSDLGTSQNDRVTAALN